MEENKNVKKSSALPILVLVLAILAVGGYFVYTKYTNNKSPKDLFISSIEKAVNKTSNIKEKDFKTLTDEFDINVKVSSPFIDKSVLDLINKLGLSGKVELDKKNNTLYTKIETTYDSLDLVKFSAYMEDNAFYMMLDDILDKWIKLDLSETNMNFDLSQLSNANIDLKKYEKVSDELETIVKDSLKDKYFKKEKFDDGYKVTLTIDKNNVKDIVIDILKGLKNSKNFKDLYKELTGTEIKSSDIDEVIKEFKEIDSKDMGDFKVEFKVYTNSKNEFEKIDITIEVEDQSYSIVVEQKDKDTIEFAIKTQGVKMFSGSFTSKEKDGKVTLKISLSMMEMFNIEINASEKIKYDAKLEKVDVSDSIEAEKLTEADLKKLEELSNSKGVKKFIEDLSKVDLESLMNGFGLDSSAESLTF